MSEPAETTPPAPPPRRRPFWRSPSLLVAGLQQQAGALRERLSGYLPSGVASALGLWRGARWK